PGAAERAEERNSVTDDGRPDREAILIGPRESGAGVVYDRRRNHTLPLSQEVMSPRGVTHRPERNVDALLADPMIIDVPEEHGIRWVPMRSHAVENILSLQLDGIGT